MARAQAVADVEHTALAIAGTVYGKKIVARLKECAGRWDRALGRSFRQYLAARPGLQDRRRKEEPPYWILLPQWLLRKGSGRGKVRARFLADILFGQCCAFLAVKIHDDVFDGHVRDRSLIFAADHLLLSAREAFAPHFRDDSPFWRTFDGSVRRTIDAIIATDECQRRGYGPPGSVRALAREGYAVCNVATYAACLSMGRTALFERVLRCTDELAFVGQLMDDLEDVQEDSQRGRRNYAAIFLRGRDDLFGGGADRWFSLLRRHLLIAARAAHHAGIPELSAYVAKHQSALAAAEALAHHQRVHLVFRGLTGRTRRSSAGRDSRVPVRFKRR